MSVNMVSVDEESLKSDLRELVRKTVQEMLNALLDEEADEMAGAERYERTAAREAYRSGHCKRKLATTGGEVALDAPKLRGAALLRLRGRGQSGVRLVTGDKSLGMLGALEEVFPEARYQRRTVRFYRNVLGKVPRQKRTRVAKMLKAIHAQESREASEAKASEVADSLESMKLFAAAKVVREGCAETLAYADFPTGQAPLSPWEAGHTRPSPAPALKDPAAQAFCNPNRESSSRILGKTPAFQDGGRLSSSLLSRRKNKITCRNAPTR